MKNRKILTVIGLSSLVILGACSSGTTQDSSHENHSTNTTVSEASTSTSVETSIASSEMMHHHDSGEIPPGMKEAENPKYPVGTHVTLTATHMPGMENAQATIVGAYDTTIYEVSYQPTNGGAEVKNHKWVVQEELEDSEEVASAGDTVVLEAEHMEGMKGANATVDEAIQGTVYVVDYEPADGGEMMMNHMWVTEAEITE
ncbi:hypothetical protein DOK78_001139 [Enterococcus sp. DIV2402]|uniref:DUF1541 domain-containing protein n=1 Tax=Candidatus Enterococcus lowellii TaxID=2230877 RepID=A0ABZ2SQ21_9ENTE|nr:YdhK family protein [Enterococcus sp. DIV2402]MBO0464660.1 DUF1541 domain-containing protein [Enterococcus sp. DIV2402]